VDSLLRAGEAIKGFILLLFNNEEVAIDIKIVVAILVMVYYNQFLSTACHRFTSAIEFRTNSFFELTHHSGSRRYLCLNINKTLWDELISRKSKQNMGGRNEI